jgi:hypothetical protein
MVSVLRHHHAANVLSKLIFYPRGILQRHYFNYCNMIPDIKES